MFKFLAVICIITSTFYGCYSSKEKKQIEAINLLKFADLFPSKEMLVTDFITKLTQLDTAGASHHIVRHNEYIMLYPYQKDADTSSQSAEFVAQMLTSSNKKHFFRWLERISTNQLKLSRVEFSNEKENFPGYTFHKGTKVFLKDSLGNENIYPIFDNILEVQGKFKIWALLDAQAE